MAVCDSVRLPVNGVLPGVAGNIKKSDDIDLGPHVKVFRNLEDVLADPEVELVDLCTPTPLHPEQAIAALKAGKHVLCEKPLARTSAAAREILKAAESAPGFLCRPCACGFGRAGVGSNTWCRTRPTAKCWPPDSGAFPKCPPGANKAPTPAAIDIGGALFDLHIHDTDFVQFLFGRPCERLLDRRDRGPAAPSITW